MGSTSNKTYEDNLNQGKDTTREDNDGFQAIKKESTGKEGFLFLDFARNGASEDIVVVSTADGKFDDNLNQNSEEESNVNQNEDEDSQEDCDGFQNIEARCSNTEYLISKSEEFVVGNTVDGKYEDSLHRNEEEETDRQENSDGFQTIEKESTERTSDDEKSNELIVGYTLDGKFKDIILSQNKEEETDRQEVYNEFKAIDSKGAKKEDLLSLNFLERGKSEELVLGGNRQGKFEDSQNKNGEEGKFEDSLIQYKEEDHNIFKTIEKGSAEKEGLLSFNFSDIGKSEELAVGNIHDEKLEDGLRKELSRDDSKEAMIDRRIKEIQKRNEDRLKRAKQIEENKRAANTPFETENMPKAQVNKSMPMPKLHNNSCTTHASGRGRGGGCGRGRATISKMSFDTKPGHERWGDLNSNTRKTEDMEKKRLLIIEAYKKELKQISKFEDALENSRPTEKTEDEIRTERALSASKWRKDRHSWQFKKDRDPRRSSRYSKIHRSGRVTDSDEANYDEWKSEREAIEAERMKRHQEATGKWKREWDQDKVWDDQTNRWMSGTDDGSHWDTRRTQKRDDSEQW